MKKLDHRLESDKRLQDKYLVFTAHIQFYSHSFPQFLVLKFSSKKDTKKASMVAKRKIAGWDEEYLARLLKTENF